MARLKAETLSISTTDNIKQLLRLAAERERRSLASMVEILVLEYSQKHSLQVEAPQPVLPTRHDYVVPKTSASLQAPQHSGRRHVPC